MKTKLQNEPVEKGAHPSSGKSAKPAKGTKMKIEMEHTRGIISPDSYNIRGIAAEARRQTFAP